MHVSLEVPNIFDLRNNLVLSDNVTDTKYYQIKYYDHVILIGPCWNVKHTKSSRNHKIGYKSTTEWWCMCVQSTACIDNKSITHTSTFQSLVKNVSFKMKLVESLITHVLQEILLSIADVRW